MIRYYTYYSVGGYKDFFLGDNLSNHEYVYYMPLIPAYRKRAENNPEYAEKVARLEKLPQMELLTREDTKRFPKHGEAMISHGGYDLIYRHIEGEIVALSCRDIDSLDNDDIGRPIPFVFCLVCDSREEWKQMDSLAIYWAEHLAEVKKKLAGMLHLDSDTSGLRFSMADFNKWIEELKTCHSVSLMEVRKAYVLRPSTIDLQDTIRLQGLDNLDVLDFPSATINIIKDVHHTLTEDEHKKLLAMAVQDARNEITAQLKQQKRKLMFVSVAIGFVLGFILALLFSTCGHNK